MGKPALEYTSVLQKLPLLLDVQLPHGGVVPRLALDGQRRQRHVVVEGRPVGRRFVHRHQRAVGLSVLGHLGHEAAHRGPLGFGHGRVEEVVGHRDVVVVIVVEHPLRGAVASVEYLSKARERRRQLRLAVDVFVHERKQHSVEKLLLDVQLVVGVGAEVVVGAGEEASVHLTHCRGRSEQCGVQMFLHVFPRPARDLVVPHPLPPLLQARGGHIHPRVGVGRKVVGPLQGLINFSLQEGRAARRVVQVHVALAEGVLKEAELVQLSLEISGRAAVVPPAQHPHVFLGRHHHAGIYGLKRGL
mmetsp:Transcript_28389/g.56812  ORF Transcript_28389/g.56812 Transcript_28389/m.56812 type:complete len:302 (-) Transcript_28389:208-1113(-)